MKCLRRTIALPEVLHIRLTALDGFLMFLKAGAGLVTVAVMTWGLVGDFRLLTQWSAARGHTNRHFSISRRPAFNPEKRVSAADPSTNPQAESPASGVTR